eukprot:CAMPEP_0197196342 /NCGR_PEP_ID=MMETSP1423-20130617/32306_1 /TAXON_ID=476441 /ORGANISM="Pseudo-nitzschia heimii, Strain UNC1101" /LENGTH=2211 /DNA_ID=CAMNT_0042650137 /DNA_START=205 /DNA_END=6840 /DNA_ORIENTATION=+
MPSLSASNHHDSPVTILRSTPAAAAAGSGGVEKNRNTPHYHFIHSMLLPSTLKIQRELKSRKFKDVQIQLAAAIELLQEFQLELWEPDKPPPKSSRRNGSNDDDDNNNNNNSNSHNTSSIESNNNNNNDEATTATETTDEATTATETTDEATTATETTEEFFANFDENEEEPQSKSDSSAVPSATTEMTVETTRPGTEEIEDDPLTRMAVHDAVSEALEAYIMTISHPLMARSGNKSACEEALGCIEQLVVREYVGGRAGGLDDHTASGSRAIREQRGGTVDEASPMHRLLEALHDCSSNVLKMPEIHTHISRCIRAILTSPRCGIHESSMLFAVRINFHSFLVTKNESCKKAAKEALLDVVEYYLQRLELDKARGPYSLWYTDCFHLMRSLIKLSSKEIEGIDETTTTVPDQNASFFRNSSTSTADMVALNNKILSLELQRRVIECAGPGFCNGAGFIQLMQSQNGSIALFKNCMSPCTEVAYISQQVFLIMCYKFKHHIKDEMQAFMSSIFFRVLESENSTCTNKVLVLESLRSLCRDPFLLSQIFLNYDCDMGSDSLYKDIVGHLSMVCARAMIESNQLEAKGGRVNLKAAEDVAELGLAGCEVLVTILHSFLEALGMDTNDDEDMIDTAGKKIREDLNITDIVASVKRRSSTFARFRQNRNLVRSSVLGIANEGTGEARSSDPESPTAADGEDDVADTILGYFERKRDAEQNLELGVVKFTMDLKKGLRFFIDNGIVTCDANDIANFFLDNKDRLDKTQMGEVLGREPDSAFIKGQPDLDPDKGGPGFFCRILHHYATSMDFTGMFFAEAIRLFLSGFRLPGEAQKIDRIMEKFAERFTSQNPDVFPSADTAFILAFSVIMLNTDLHNPSIKEERRMTTDSFIRNNRGIGKDGTDLDPAFLTKIFDRIKEKPFSLKEDDAAREKVETDTFNNLLGDNGGLLGAGLFGTTAEERKKQKFMKEREDMVSATESLIRRKKDRATKAENLTDAVDPAHVVKPMFDVTWGAIIGTLSQVMEVSNDNRLITLCLTGFVYGIRISAQSNMSLARDTFLGSLAKFTYLGSSKGMSRKNIKIIRTLMNIAVTDGDCLGESWGPVLQCISQLSRMRIAASGLDNDEAFLQDSTHSKKSAGAKNDASTSSISMFASETKEEIRLETEMVNSVIVLNTISDQLIDQVFSSSTKLSAESLALFIEQLIAVANSEIDGNSKSGITGVSISATGSNHGDAGPSIFSMQRLVEVADYNMHIRPKLVWAQIWGLMSVFFCKIGCHENQMVSAFAIDALKQLSLKFLEKPEASELQLQRLFLEPFLVIMKNKNNPSDTRELLLACVEQMIDTRVAALKSGWRIFFDILLVGAKDSNKKVLLHSLRILQRILDDHLDKLSFLTQADSEESSASNVNADAEDYLAMCQASLSFLDCQEGKTTHPSGLSMRALSHLTVYADLIAGKRILPPNSGAQTDDPDAPGYTYEGLGEEEGLEMILWRPLFEGLAKGAKSTSRCRADGTGKFLQRSSVVALRTILLRHGSCFSDNQLKVVLADTILPAFQEALEQDKSPVVSIASETPSISSIDFLVAPFPIPPECDDDSLIKFQQISRQSGHAPRSMGPSELLLEATFTVMRNGGGDDPSEAYKFAKKDMESKEAADQPFPDSWIATTAPIALGALTDLSSEILLPRGAKGADVWRSTVGATYLRWCNGDITSWVPCEAVVRIATSELKRFMTRATDTMTNTVEKEDKNAWSNQLIEFYTEVMGRNVLIAKEMLSMVLESKCPTVAENKADGNPSSSSEIPSAAIDDSIPPSSQHSNEESTSSPESSDNWISLENQDGTVVSALEITEHSLMTEHSLTRHDGSDTGTPQGSDVESRTREGSSTDAEAPTDDDDDDDESPTREDGDDDGTEEGGTKSRIVIAEVDLRTLYPSDADNDAILPVETFARLDERYDNPDSPDWMRLLPALKLRCVAAHYLQQILLSLPEEELIGFVSHETVSNLLKVLNASRDFAEDAAKNEDLAHAFQEAMFREWGIGDEMSEEALETVAGLNHTQGSAMFFLTQTAGATNGVNRLLTSLYDHEETYAGEDRWDRRVFAGQCQVEIMEDIFRKFAESEAKEGHKVDPNVWRNSSESGSKVAMYCTSFASVVVGLLNAMLSFEPALIERNKGLFFPLVCELVGSRSEEIRKLVRRVLTEKFGPILGLGQDTTGKKKKPGSPKKLTVN